MTKNKLILISLIGVSLIGCGQAPTGTSASLTEATIDCSKSNLVGSWLHPKSLDVVKFKADCSFESIGCGSSGTFSTPKVVSTANYVETSTSTVTITKAPSYSSCVQAGTHSCNFSINANDASVTFSCDGGSSYTYYWVTQ